MTLVTKSGNSQTVLPLKESEKLLLMGGACSAFSHPLKLLYCSRNTDFLNFPTDVFGISFTNA